MKMDVVKALHWYVIIKSLRILNEEGGEASIDYVTNRLAEESGDRALAEAWVMAATREGLVTVSNGVARLTEKGRSFISGDRARHMATEVARVLFLDYGIAVRI